MEEKRKRPILIGKTSAGKTTLCQCINHEALKYHKTQTIQLVNDRLIDTPGEYLERRSFWGALLVTAADADVIMLVQDATEDTSMFPPGYAGQFPKPVVGVVTKCDLASTKQIENAKKYLEIAGVKNIFPVSSVTGEGVEGLVRYLDIL
ncbi:MAG: EutP/PduV family microcompartment system protein [Oscillospiraceae bacterium]|jgi:ethanolamine utilization protein EutP